MACIVFSLEDGTTFTTTLESELTTVGRHVDSMVVLPSGSVSSHHGAIRWREDGFYVQDLGSRNGTRVNGVEIEEALLNDGDRVAFGDVQAVYYVDDEPPVVAAPAPVSIPQPTVQKLVTEAPPVSGIPPGAGRYQPKPRKAPPRRLAADEGSGCMTGFIMMILFALAFVIGLSLRHYEVTNGGVLPSDLVEKLFNKAGKIHIESSDEK